MKNQIFILLFLYSIIFAVVNTAGSPIVSNVQVRDLKKSGAVWTATIVYDLFDNATKSLWVWAFLSTDGGTTWRTFQSAGDTGSVAIGQGRSIDFSFSGDGGADCIVRVYASSDPTEYKTYKTNPEKNAPVPEMASVDGNSTVAYLQAAKKSNGAYGPHGQTYSDLYWNYAAVHALTLLGVQFSNKSVIYQNGSVTTMRDKHVNAFFDNLLAGLLDQRSWKGQSIKVDEPCLEDTWYTVCSIISLGGTVSNISTVVTTAKSRQYSTGGFADITGTESLTKVTADEVHIIWTYFGVMTLAYLKQEFPNKQKIIDWIRACQTSSGGFKYNPGTTSPGNYADIWYTWAAVLSLDALGSEPIDKPGCIKWINSLQNSDGGFGDQPGWNSGLMSTYHAVHALKVLTGSTLTGITSKKVPVPNSTPIPSGLYKIYQSQHKSPDGEAYMVDKAYNTLKYNFLGVKAENSGWIETYSAAYADIKPAIDYAKSKKYSMTIVPVVEFHDQKITYPGGRIGDHVANYAFPPGLSSAEILAVDGANTAGAKALRWKDYQEQVIKPILKHENLFYPEWENGTQNEKGWLVAWYTYDDGVYGKNGYNAIHTACHSGPDRMRLYPWRLKYLEELPFIADIDAHGDIDDVGTYTELNQYRVLYLADSSDYSSYIKACQNGMSACLIRYGSDVTYYGRPNVVNYLKAHKTEWQWW
jgi:prenyltransferase beta subunit